MVVEVMKMREEEKKRTSQNSNWQKLMKKRWVFPAIYLASAAIILTGVLMFQAGTTPEEPANETEGNGPTTSQNGDQPAVEVTSPVENFVMPVVDESAAVVEKYFWDPNASEEEQENSFIYYNGIYQPNTGIDIAMRNGEAFDVVASLSGKVVRVDDKDTLLGNVIEIEHEDGVKTVYTSVTNIVVKEGDTVEQGQVIAQAGTSLMNKEITHVHFEIRKDEMAVNPLSFFKKPVTALLDAGNVSAEQDEDAPQNDGEEDAEQPEEGQPGEEDGSDDSEN